MTLLSQDIQRCRPEISCMRFPFVQSSLAVGKDPEMSPEKFCAVECSAEAPGLLLAKEAVQCWAVLKTSWACCFSSQTSCPTAQLCCCAVLRDIVVVHSVSDPCQQFFHPTLLQSSYYSCMTPSSFPRLSTAEFC